MSEGASPPHSLRRAVFEIIEPARRGHFPSKLFDIFIIVLIVTNVAAAVIATVPWIGAQYGVMLGLFDLVCVVIFLVEYICRLWTAPEHAMFRDSSPSTARWLYARTPLMIIDAATLLPFLLQLFLPYNLAFFRILRVVRFLRLARYSPAILIIGRVFMAERRALFGTAVLFVGVLVLMASLMYLAEASVQPDKLGDIPSAMWWAVVTLSTVGYGDVIPVTVAGRIIAGITMILGLMFLALPVGIIATGFQQEIHRRDFIVSFGMVARVPLFNRLDAATIAQLVSVLHARKVAAGVTVFTQGDQADAMYFIASGEVEVELPTQNVQLGEGDFFGEIALLQADTRRTATVSAVKPSQLLLLEKHDFHRMLAKNSALAAAMREVAQHRTAANLAAGASPPPQS